MQISVLSEFHCHLCNCYWLGKLDRWIMSRDTRTTQEKDAQNHFKVSKEDDMRVNEHCIRFWSNHLSCSMDKYEQSFLIVIADKRFKKQTTAWNQEYDILKSETHFGAHSFKAMEHIWIFNLIQKITRSSSTSDDRVNSGWSVWRHKRTSMAFDILLSEWIYKLQNSLFLSRDFVLRKWRCW